ncbi:MAG: prolyl-tRNA synthetase associated domain-containing protein [Pseudomonadota bacterium]
MLHDRRRLLDRLDEWSIPFEMHEHPAVFTVDEARVHTAHIPGGHCKNLFLKDKRDGLWLVTVLDRRRVDLNGLAKRLGAGRFSFGKPPLLADVLGVTPGAVTPLAVINDDRHRVRLIVDHGLLAFDRVNCHPLENTATVVLNSADLLRFFRGTGHEPQVVDFDDGLDLA